MWNINEIAYKNRTSFEHNRILLVVCGISFLLLAGPSTNFIWECLFLLIIYGQQVKSKTKKDQLRKHIAFCRFLWSSSSSSSSSSFSSSSCSSFAFSFSYSSYPPSVKKSTIFRKLPGETPAIFFLGHFRCVSITCGKYIKLHTKN